MQIISLAVGPLEANCYLVWEDAAEAVAVDPGAKPERILKAAADNGLTVRTVLLTHGHFDHIGALSALRERYGATVVVGDGDEEMLENREKSLASQVNLSLPPVTADRVVMDGDLVQVGGLLFEVLSTPGHSPGSVCYRCGNVLFTGDTLFAGSVGRTDLPGGDFREMGRSLRRLAALEGEATVYPGHGPTSTLENERAYNPFLESLR